MNRKNCSRLLLLFGICLSIGVKTMAGPCPIKDPAHLMACQQTGNLVFYTGLAIAALALLQLVVKKRQALFLIGLTTLITMSFMGISRPLCASPHMHCQLVMKPFVLLVGVMLLVVSLLAYFKPQQGGRKCS